MQKVIVSGATSMLGCRLIEECISGGVQVVALVRKGSPSAGRVPSHRLVTVVECDLDGLGALRLDGRCDVFYHFAWEGTFGQVRNDARVQLSNIGYTLDAVGLARRLGCRAFVGAGSQAEYGIYAGRIFPDTRVQPVTAYGIAKYAAGRLAEGVCRETGMQCIWTRIFSVYGEHDNENTMIKYAIRSFLGGRPAQFSAATQMWNYLYEGDAGKIFYLLGEREVKGGVYNVASADTRPLKEFIFRLADLCGVKPLCTFAPPPEEQPVSLDPDISSLTAAIGWTPDTSFARGIGNILKQYKV